MAANTWLALFGAGVGVSAEGGLTVVGGVAVVSGVMPQSITVALRLFEDSWDCSAFTKHRCAHYSLACYCI